MNRSAHVHRRRDYGTLWSILQLPLRELEQIASEPELLDGAESLGSLRLALHEAAELADSIVPRRAAFAIHGELAGALAEARDLTDEVAAAVEAGELESVLPLVWEWRGALFRVRFARLRLARPQEALAGVAHAGRATLLVPALVLAFALGVLTMVLAALAGAWP